MPDIRRMYELQGVDLELGWRNARLAEIQKALGDGSSLVPLRDESRIAKTEADASSASQAGLDLAIGGFDAKIADAETKLYGGTVKLPRELQDLQADIAMIKRQRGEREDVLLAVLDELDTTQERSKAADAALSQAEEAWNADQASMSEEQRRLKSEVAGLTSDRTARAAGIAPADIALYEQVRKAHHGKAVAKMAGSMCESCRVAVPTRQAQDARTSDKVVRCPNCGLILLAA